MEYLDIIDINGNLTNLLEERKEVHKNGLLHHASGVIFIRKNKKEYELLSQQRSFNKEKNAGLWDLSASGHVPSGQTPINSLIREIKEELGIEIIESDLILLGKFWRNEIHKNNFIENELDYIYVCKKDINISNIIIQKEEVEDVKWISFSEFKTLLDKNKAVRRENVWERLFQNFKNC